MKRKILISITIIAVLLMSNLSALTVMGAELDHKQIEAERNAENVEGIVGTDQVASEMEETRNGFDVTIDEQTMTIPKEGDADIEMSSEDGSEDISMSLPQEAELSDAIVTTNGTIVYEGDNDATVSVQPLQIEESDLTVMGNRTMVTIENKNASKEYSFEYKLPENSRLVKAEDYYQDMKQDEPITDEEIALEKGWIYVVDADNEILAAIEPAWAQDADGNSVPTYYEISGTTLIQVVEFGQGSKFPIIADPKTTKKPKSEKVGSDKYTCKLDHTKVGAGITFTGGGYKIATAAKKTLAKKIAAKVGGYFIPTIGWTSLAVDIYCSFAALTKHNYTKFTIKYETWTQYKHQAGAWRKGYKVKVTNIGATWSN